MGPVAAAAAAAAGAAVEAPSWTIDEVEVRVFFAGMTSLYTFIRSKWLPSPHQVCMSWIQAKSRLSFISY